MSERRIQHEYFTAPHSSEVNHNSWFSVYTEGLPNLLFVQEDIRFSRNLLASMLIEAWNCERFFEENSYLKPKPNKADRMMLITYLQQLASFTGLLNGEEIREIQDTEGRVKAGRFVPKEGPIFDFEQIVALTKAWKALGLRIGLYHGSFDPVTVVHLACATEAYVECDRLLVGFDGDFLLKKRKGEERPRYPLVLRRQIFGSFWMVDGTFVLRAKSVDDVEAYVQDYRALGVDYVFLATNQQDIEARLNKIRLAGAEPRYLLHESGLFSATEILRLFEERRTSYER